jgi:polysaccharide biosynthesis transport protein
MIQIPSLPPGREPVEITPSNGHGQPSKFGYIEAQGYTYAQGYPADEPEAPGLVEYWRILSRRKGTLILVSFLGLAAAVLITVPQTPIYQSSTAIEIQDINDDFLNIKQVTPVQDAPSTGHLTDIQTQVKIIQSETLLERSANLLKKKQPASFNARRDRVSAWRELLRLPKSSPMTPYELEVENIRKEVHVKPSGQTRIVEVLCDSSDPNLAAAFCNTMVSEYIDQNMEARWTMSERTGEWLSRQLADMRVRLERSEDGLQNYARQSGLLFTSEKENVSEEKLRQLQAALSAAQADRVAKQSRYEITRTVSTDTLSDAVPDGSLNFLVTRLADLRRQEAELTTTFTTEHSSVKRVRAQIASLEKTLTEQRGIMLNRIRNDYEEALKREKLLAGAYANQSHLVTQQAEKSIQYNILKREVDSNRQLYESMLQRVKESSIVSAMRASNVRVVDQARPAKSPYKPRLVLNSLLGLFLGGFLGAVFIIVRERADRSIQSPGDLSLYMNVPELGVIPAAEKAGKRNLLYGRRKDEIAVDGRPESGRVELVTWQRKPSPVAESFRAALTSILFTGHNGDRPRVIVFTSPSPREGKTTVVSNLGIALAEIHRKVVLIDADMRKPRLHDIFGLSNESGLSTFLRNGAADASPELFATEVNGLYVLPSGPADAGIASLLHSPQIPGLLRRLRQEFDMVLIDTPPMLQMPDARVLGRLADGVILVVRSNQTMRDAALAAKDRFEGDGTRVIGTVLNNWDLKHSSTYGYGYGYGYGKGDSYYSKDREARNG